MLKATLYEKTKIRQGEILALPGGREVSLPFLPNIRTDALFVNPAGETESILFIDSPLEIDPEKIICPKKFGRLLSTKILAQEITFDTVKQLYFIYLVQPVEVQTRVLGIFRLQCLGVDLRGVLKEFIREETPA